MQTLELKDALDVLVASSELLNTLWNFYAVIAIGVLGFVYSKEGIRNSAPARAAIAVGFAVFAITNFRSLYLAQSNFNAVVRALKDAGSATHGAVPPGAANTAAPSGPVNFANVIAGLQELPPTVTAAIHLVLTAFVVLTIVSPDWNWLKRWWRGESGRRA
jgi:hypothetical protein